MAAIVDKVQSVFTKPGHEQPEVYHRKKILLALTSATPQMPDHRSGWHFSELLHAYQVFTQNGWDVDIISESGAATVDEASVGKMATATDLKYWEDKQYPLHGKLAAMRAAKDINTIDSYAAIYFAGGHACVVDLPTATELKSLTARIYEAGGVVGAVCHGIAIFQDLRLSNGSNILQGKSATGFSKKGEESMPGAMDWLRKNNYRTMEEVVKMSGGTWKEHSSDPWADYTISDARLVTGVNPASAKSVAQEMLKYLPSEKECETTRATGVSSGVGLQDKSRLPTENVEKGRAYQGERTTTV